MIYTQPPRPANSYQRKQRDWMIEVLKSYQKESIYKERCYMYRSPSTHIDWRYVLSKSIAKSQPCVMVDLIARQKDTETIQWICSRNATKEQVPVRYISRELCDSFTRTPAPEILPSEAFELYPGMIIMLPKNYLETDENDWIDYIIVYTGSGKVLFTKEEENYYFNTFGKACGGVQINNPGERVFMAYGASFYNDYYVHHVEGVKLDTSVDPEIGIVTEKIYRIAASTIMAHLYEPELISTPHFPSSSGFASKQRNSILRNLPITWVGKDFRSSRVSSSASRNSQDAPRAAMRPHWRRGHWHHVACGQGRQERAMRWYRPVFVNG